jgi:hypothetical protein
MKKKWQGIKQRKSQERYLKIKDMNLYSINVLMGLELNVLIVCPNNQLLFKVMESLCRM